MNDFELPERVYVENDWYDGPRSGIADVHGAPHRFEIKFEAAEGECGDTFLIQPVDPETLALEIEQWRIFVAWNDKYEAGLVKTDTHPGKGGTNERWDELERILKPRRVIDTLTAKLARAKFEWIEDQKRYDVSGPDYVVQWQLL